MTGWDKLVDSVCPAEIAWYINNSRLKEPAFSPEYIQELEEHCYSVSMIGKNCCSTCWADFLKSEVK